MPFVLKRQYDPNFPERRCHYVAPPGSAKSYVTLTRAARWPTREIALLSVCGNEIAVEVGE